MADIFSKWFNGLERTRKQTFGRISSLLGTSEITNDTWDDLEAALIQADMGLETTQSVIESLKATVDKEGLTHAPELQEKLREELINRLDPAPESLIPADRPAVILLVGVNGSGKTTTAAKLGKRYSNEGLKVLLAAADTYRAAAVDQLQVWADRLNIPIISGQTGGDPGAVAFDAVEAAKARGTDLLLIDTAGRLHTRFNLMEELKKVHRVVGKALTGAPHGVWLVLDATTGQNALQQARSFNQTTRVTGVILTKLDSSARGGMAFAIQRELHVPILFAGLGEKPEDLQPFDRNEFVNGILAEH
ncbi:signal recognition particle-docking protein FtsY [Leptolinea tardivitalis]|uniref:signal recognition particle-docking protein FtsY n=1 Tax=Leptolinea tardivitalis TaxID=229920 RepID=UPI0009D74A62|nr:signal recognition particle-docking protein FtsY [Leptolinea tardivitalis]GAP20981.1 signal recognition particle-docking protein FtsY [Leptolinea tardivitalis]